MFIVFCMFYLFFWQVKGHKSHLNSWFHWKKDGVVISAAYNHKIRVFKDWSVKSHWSDHTWTDVMMWAFCRELNPTRWAVTNYRSEEKRISWVKECYALCHFLSALMWFHGPDKYHGEKEDMERERVSAIGIKPKKPWELFTDTSLRWQLLTLVVIHMSQQLNGINAVCISPR